MVKIDTLVDASGYAKPAIFIDVEGDEWEEKIDRTPDVVKDCNFSSEEIIKKIADAGIVGLGGACFPTQVKLTPPPTAKAECIIINAVECEPYLTADHQLMLEHAEEIMVGVSILMKAVKVNKAYIGIENNKPDAIELMAKVASGYAGIAVVPLKVRYPQGGEKQLIDAVISRQVASGALPISVGAVVQNVGTAFAVYEAVQKNKPLFERVVVLLRAACVNHTVVYHRRSLVVDTLGVGSDNVAAYHAQNAQHLIVAVYGILVVDRSIIVLAAILEVSLAKRNYLLHQRMRKMILEILIILEKISHNYLLFCL